MGRGRKLMSSVFRRHFRGDEKAEVEQRSTEKTWPSDGDRKHWVAEPDIDRKATEFINKERRRINMGVYSVTMNSVNRFDASFNDRDL